MATAAVNDPSVTPTSSRSLDTAPPRPPGRSQSVLQMGREPSDQTGLGLLGADPSIQILQNLQESRNVLMKLAASLPPPHSDAIQQMVTALMQAVPQMMADIVSGQVPNQGPVGGPGAMAPSAPPPAAGPTSGPAPAGP
jgi:hypothetical protein